MATFRQIPVGGILEDTSTKERPHDMATTPRGYTMQRDDYLKRLRRIEGQIRGLQRMVENDEYCIDILTQVSAATKALQSVAVGLLDEHLRHCVADAVAAGDEVESGRMIGEATSAIERLVKS
jgi:CsoR family transcriptional regulator, copper-sensing transcriptional repressor